MALSNPISDGVFSLSSKKSKHLEGLCVMPEVQLNLFSLISQNSDTSLIFNTCDPAKSNRLRQMADKMQKAIDSKKNSAISKQRRTARRVRIVQTIYEEGLMLEQIQSWLYALADAASIGTLPDILNQITTKAGQLERS